MLRECSAYVCGAGYDERGHFAQKIHFSLRDEIAMRVIIIYVCECLIVGRASAPRQHVVGWSLMGVALFFSVINVSISMSNLD